MTRIKGSGTRRSGLKTQRKQKMTVGLFDSERLAVSVAMVRGARSSKHGRGGVCGGASLLEKSALLSAALSLCFRGPPQRPQQQHKLQQGAQQTAGT